MTPTARRQLPPLADYDRVREAVRRADLDAIVCTLPHNVYYLTGLDSPSMWRMQRWSSFAIIPAGSDPALVISQLYLSAEAEMELWIRDLYPYARGENILWDAAELLESEQLIKQLKGQLQPKLSPTPFDAVVRVLRDRGLLGGKIGFDDSAVVGFLPVDGIQAFEAADVVRAARMVKTEAEIEWMRQAAIWNEDSSLDAISILPDGFDFEAIIRRYRSNLALRGGEAIYMLTGSPHHTGTFQHQFKDYRPARGEFFMLDALGTIGHYHGDFGRTYAWGDPGPKVRTRYDAMRKGFEAGYAKSRPGVPLEVVRDTVIETVRREGLPEFVACTPHSVGLEHTDMPRVPGQTVRDCMTMNIDIVYMEAGFGALHLEDTYLVRQAGNELLTSGNTELIVLG